MQTNAKNPTKPQASCSNGHDHVPKKGQAKSQADLKKSQDDLKKKESDRQAALQQSIYVKQIIETLFDTYDTDLSLFLEENEVRDLLKDLYEDMGQGAPDEDTIQGFMESAGSLGKFTKKSLVDLLSPIFSEGFNELEEEE